MRNRRVILAEYVVRITVPQSGHAMLVKCNAQFTKSVCQSMRDAVCEGARKALGDHVKARKLGKAFKVSIQ